MQADGNLLNKVENVVNKNVENKKYKNTFLKYVPVLIGLTLILIISILKFTIKDFSWSLYGVLIASILLAIVAFYLIPQIAEKEIENKNKKPTPLTIGQLRLKAYDALTNKYYVNHTTMCYGEKTITLPKSGDTIYQYKTKVLYEDEETENGWVYVLINANYPDRMSILFDPTTYELSQAKKELGTETEEELPVEEIETRNDILGVTQISKKPIVKETKEEKKEEDFR